MTNALDTLSWVVDKTRACGADAVDAIMFETTDVNMSRRMGKPEGLERSESKALGLRAFVGQRQAIVSTTDVTGKDTLAELATRAVAMAKAAPADPDSTLAPARSSSLADIFPNLDLFDEKEPDIKWLGEQCQQAEEAALSIKGITNSEGADAHYGRSSINLVIANGKWPTFCA